MTPISTSPFCHDPQIDRLRASFTDRDRIFVDDFVGIVLDTYGDNKRAYEFFINAHGIQGDLLWYANRAEEEEDGASGSLRGAKTMALMQCGNLQPVPMRIVG